LSARYQIARSSKNWCTCHWTAAALHAGGDGLDLDGAEGGPGPHEVQSASGDDGKQQQDNQPAPPSPARRVPLDPQRCEFVFQVPHKRCPTLLGGATSIALLPQVWKSAAYCLPRAGRVEGPSFSQSSQSD